MQIDPGRFDGRVPGLGLDGPVRCSSRSYNYKLTTPRGAYLWRVHWHPTGVSPVKEPHLHLPPDLNRGLPTGRLTFEKVIVWLIEFDAPIRVSREEALSHWLRQKHHISCTGPGLRRQVRREADPQCVQRATGFARYAAGGSWFASDRLVVRDRLTSPSSGEQSR